MRLLLRFVLYLLPLHLSAQEFVVDRWQVEEGLPNNSINCLFQTHDGYLWIGTHGGLARFDGLSFTNYDMARIPALRSNRILGLFEDQQQRLWMGTYGGGVCYYRDGKFHPFRLTAGGDYDNVSDIAEIPGRGIFFLSTNNGFYWFRPDQSLLHFGQDQGLSSSTVTNVFRDQEGNTVIVTSKGLHILQGEKLIPHPFNANGMPLENLHAVQYFAPGNCLYGTIISYKGHKGALFRWQDGLMDTFSHFQTVGGNGMSQLQQKEIFLRGLNGIWRVKTRGLPGLEPLISIQKQAAIGDAYELIRDREGNYWVGTGGQGLFRLKANPFNSLDYTSSGPGNSVLCLSKDKQQQLWWTSRISGISTYQNGEVLNKTPTGIINLWSTYARNDTVFFTGFNNPLFYYSGDGRLHTIKLPNYKRKDYWIRAIYHYQGRLWLGGYAELLTWSPGGFWSPPQAENPAAAHINRFFEDSRGHLYLLCDAGLFRYDKNYQLQAYKDEQLRHVRCAYELPDGTLLFGTYGNGLVVLKNGEFRQITNANGLNDNTISEILVIREQLWMAGNKGLSRINLEEFLDYLNGQRQYLNSFLYDKSDGLHISEFNGGTQSSVVQMADGRYAFPSINGVSLVDFSKLQFNKVPPPVSIEKVLVGEKLYTPDSLLVFPAEENRVEFYYTALSLVSAKNNRFRYRLIGFDPNWIDAGGERKAVYTRLPPGDYIFQVIACNNDGVWNESGTQLRIRIPPLYYQTAWFKALLILGSLAIITAGVLLLLWNQKRKERLRAQLKEMTQQARIKAVLDTEEAERKRIAEDLHDGIGPLLSTVKLNLDLAQRKTDSAELLRESAREIDQIAAELRSITYNLVPAALSAFGLNAALHEFLDKLRQQEHIQILFQEHGETHPLGEQATLFIFRTLQEILNNAIKHSQSREITLQLIYHEDSLMVMVEDNGIGFNFEEAFQKNNSRGLKNMMERIRSLGGTLHIDSRPGSGTTITFEVPYPQI